MLCCISKGVLLYLSFSNRKIIPLDHWTVAITAGRLFGAKRSPHSPLRGIPADVRDSMFFDVFLQIHNRNSTGISSTCSILHLHLFHTHIFCPLVVDQSGSRVDLMESRLALRKSAGGTVVTSSDMGETSSISAGGSGLAFRTPPQHSQMCYGPTNRHGADCPECGATWQKGSRELPHPPQEGCELS